MFRKIINKIDEWLLGFSFSATNEELKALQDLDIHNISVEVVAKVLKTSEKEAERICETAVRQGIFKKTYSYIENGFDGYDEL